MSDMEYQDHFPGPILDQFAGLGSRVEILEKTIAEMKALEASLHEMQSIIFKFAENLHQGLILIQDEKILWMNEAGCRIFGYKLEELINNPPVMLAHPEYSLRMKARFNSMRSGDFSPVCEDLPFRRKDRTLVYLRSFEYGIVYGGKPAIMSVFYDMTEDKQLKEELAWRAEMLELIADLLFLLDTRGNIKYVNKAMYESLGYTRDEMLGRPILDFHTKEHQEKVKIRLKLATSTSFGIYRTEYICKDGTLIPVIARGKVVTLGGVEYIIAVARQLEIHAGPI